MQLQQPSSLDVSELSFEQLFQMAEQKLTELEHDEA